MSFDVGVGKCWNPHDNIVLSNLLKFNTEFFRTSRYLVHTSQSESVCFIVGGQAWGPVTFVYDLAIFCPFQRTVYYKIFLRGRTWIRPWKTFYDYNSDAIVKTARENDG